MANTLKVLGQVAPSAATLTTLYTVPAATTTVVNSITVANTSATPTAFRVSVQIAAAADNIKQYIAYDTNIAGNDVINLGPIALGAADVLKVYATLATLSFSAFGQEIA